MTEVNDVEVSQKPERVFKSGGVYASVFQQTGAKGLFKVANIHRRFKGQDGQWKSAYNYTAKQLKDVSKVAGQALEYIEQHESQQPVKVKEKQAA